LSDLVFCKLGGSLITDKTREATPRPEVISRLAREVREALAARPALRLVLGHGSGSFGHFAAQRYQVHRGGADARGYAETGAAAARLNRLVVDAFLAEGVPVVAFQPSASARCVGGELVELAVRPLEGALARGLVPVVYGDVALDDQQGSAIISTERVFGYLAGFLRPGRIVLAGEVDGVFTADPLRDPAARLIPEIARHNIEEVRAALAGSRGVDVTGGMLSKVLDMLALAREWPGLEALLVSGLRPGWVREALAGNRPAPSTWLHE